MICLRAWLWVLPLLILPLGAFIFSSGLELEPDNLKYMGIAWCMQQSGDYLLPMANGAPYTDKPPLLFWIIIACWHFFGVNTVGLQCLISFFIAAWIFITKATYTVLFPTDQAGKVLLPYIMVSSFAVLGYSHFLHVDLFLITGVLLTNLGICKYLCSASIEPPRTNMASNIYIALGVLIGLFAKGPVVYVFTLLPCVISMLFNRKYRTHFFKILVSMVAGTAVFLFVWVVPVMLRASHEFFQQILYKQIAGRAVLDGEKSHFFYLLKLPYLLIPWAINILFIRKFSTVIVDVWKKSLFVLMIIVVGVVVLSFFGQKRFWYLLPCIPYCIIAMTRFFVVYRENINVFRLNLIFFLFFFSLLAMFSLGLYFFPGIQKTFFSELTEMTIFSPAILISLLISSVLMVGYLCVLRHTVDLTHLLGVCGLVLALMYGVATPYFFSLMEELSQVASIKKILEQQNRHGDGVVLLISANPIYAFNYLAKMPVIPVLYTATEMTSWLMHYPRGIVIVDAKQCPQPLRLVLSSQDMDYQLCRQ